MNVVKQAKHETLSALAATIIIILRWPQPCNWRQHIHLHSVVLLKEASAPLTYQLQRNQSPF
jgi:hypothetical protein